MTMNLMRLAVGISSFRLRKNGLAGVEVLDRDGDLAVMARMSGIKRAARFLLAR